MSEPKMNLSALRLSYTKNELNEKKVSKFPFEQFKIWFDEILNSEIIEPNAMVLSTSSEDGSPSSRVVLLKEFDDEGFIFFTNYESEKGKCIEKNSKVSLLFFWKELERQIRINGVAKKTDRNISEKYFNSRPILSRIAAAASPQSNIINDRSQLEKMFEEYKSKNSDKIETPLNWGGYKIIPHYFEFWQGRENRLHDRIVYKKENNDWKIFRLAP